MTDKHYRDNPAEYNGIPPQYWDLYDRLKATVQQQKEEEYEEYLYDRVQKERQIETERIETRKRIDELKRSQQERLEQIARQEELIQMSLEDMPDNLREECSRFLSELENVRSATLSNALKGISKADGRKRQGKRYKDIDDFIDV